MWLDLLALALLAVFGVVGAVRGAFKSGMGLLTLVVAYASAVMLASALAPAVESGVGVSELLALPLAGSLAFVGAFLGMSFVTALLRRLTQDGEFDPSPRDRFLGAVFGLVRGGLVVLLVSWLALWLDALRETGAEAPIPEIGPSAAARVTGVVVEQTTLAALGDDAGGRVAARIAARPAVAVRELQDVLEAPQVDALRRDGMFWTYVEHDSIDAALNRSAFRDIAYDQGLRTRLADLGLVAPEAADDPDVFREEVATVLEQIGPRLRGLREDPELQALLDDPQVVAMIQSGDTMGLIRHPGFRGLVDRISSQSVASSQTP